MFHISHRGDSKWNPDWFRQWHCSRRRRVGEGKKRSRTLHQWYRSICWLWLSGEQFPGAISLCNHGWATALWLQLHGDRRGAIMDSGIYGYERVWIFVNKSGLLIARFSIPDKYWSVSIEFRSQQVWIHLVVTWQSRSGIKVYLDGELAATTKSPSSMIFPFKYKPRFVLGAFSSYYFKHNMSLDKLRVWDTTMDDQEVLALYTMDAGLNWDIPYCYIQSHTGG